MWYVLAIVGFLAYTAFVYMVGVRRNRAHALGEIESIETLATEDGKKALNWLRSRLKLPPA